jgi:hypothetical protein
MLVIRTLTASGTASMLTVTQKYVNENHCCNAICVGIFDDPQAANASLMRLSKSGELSLGSLCPSV